MRKVKGWRGPLPPGKSYKSLGLVSPLKAESWNASTTEQSEVQSSEQVLSEAISKTGDTPVKKRRGRPPKGRKINNQQAINIVSETSKDGAIYQHVKADKSPNHAEGDADQNTTTVQIQAPTKSSPLTEGSSPMEVEKSLTNRLKLRRGRGRSSKFTVSTGLTASHHPRVSTKTSASIQATKARSKKLPAQDSVTHPSLNISNATPAKRGRGRPPKHTELSNIQEKTPPNVAADQDSRKDSCGSGYSASAEDNQKMTTSPLDFKPEGVTSPTDKSTKEKNREAKDKAYLEEF